MPATRAGSWRERLDQPVHLGGSELPDRAFEHLPKMADSLTTTKSFPANPDEWSQSMPGSGISANLVSHRLTPLAGVSGSPGLGLIGR